VITYNAGLHDCDTNERVPADEYRSNLRAVFETLKPAAAAVAFVTTTPYPMNGPGGSDPHPAGINMSCVLEYNEIAREVADDVGAVAIDDLYGYVQAFCPGLNYSTCAVQTSGVHFNDKAPLPSGQQYTAFLVAGAAMRLIPEADFPRVAATDGPRLALAESKACGLSSLPLNTSTPNVLIIGDSISQENSGYGISVRRLLEAPPSNKDARGGLYETGSLASVQHNGGWPEQPGHWSQASSTDNGVACIDQWVGEGGWDVISMNFGIHDCWPKQQVEPDAYVRNLEAIYNASRAALAPNGKILWTTTTPTPRDCEKSEDCDVADSCVTEYNHLAAKLFADKPDVVVNDLNNAVKQVCGDGYLSCALQLPNNVHFTEAGKQYTAVAVASAIAPLLGSKWAELSDSKALIV